MKIAWKAITVVTAATGLVMPAWGQEDKRTRIDVQSYVIEAQVDPATQTLAARATVQFIPLDDQTTNATFELNNNLNISKITGADGQPITGNRNQQENSVRLSFPAALPKGQPVSVTFNYDGRLTG